MKGIILAGGAGSRLYPMTEITTKQLLPIYDKPMIYYSLSTLMLTGIKDFLIISTEQDTPSFEKLLGSGKQLGINIQYCIQPEPNGISEAFILGKDFIGNSDVALMLGDNMFYGDFSIFRNTIEKQKLKSNGANARIFAYYVSDAERYGVVEFEKENGRVLGIEEKPKKPKSNYAIPGFYIFDHTVVERALQQKPSARGELEITDTIKTYLNEDSLNVQIIPRGMAWLDTGTPESLLEAGQFIASIEQRQGLKVACLEEVAFKQGFINHEELGETIKDLPNCDYKDYLTLIYQENNS